MDFPYISDRRILHGPWLLPDKAKFTVCSIIQLATIAFDETSSYWSAPKSSYFSAFHWSPHGCLITTGQHFVTTRVVYLPKRTETNLITESDQSRANHQLLQLCTVRTAWSDSDQAVRAVHSCKSWFLNNSCSLYSLWLLLQSHPYLPEAVASNPLQKKKNLPVIINNQNLNLLKSNWEVLENYSQNSVFIKLHYKFTITNYNDNWLHVPVISFTVTILRLVKKSIIKCFISFH